MTPSSSQALQWLFTSLEIKSKTQTVTNRSDIVTVLLLLLCLLLAPPLTHCALATRPFLTAVPPAHQPALPRGLCSYCSFCLKCFSYTCLIFYFLRNLFSLCPFEISIPRKALLNKLMITELTFPSFTFSFFFLYQST